MFGHLVIYLKSLFAQNQFLAGGFILGLIAGILASLRKFPAYLYQKAKAVVLTSIEIDSKEEVYPWIVSWLAAHPKKKKFKTVMPVVKWVQKGDRSLPEIGFAPSEGFYFFLFHRTSIWIQMTRKENVIGDFSIGETKKLTIMKIGKSKAVLDALLQDAYYTYSPNDFTEIRVYHCTSGYWMSYRTHPIRTRESLVFDDGIVDRLLADADLFVSRKEWYRNLGIPYRRGYLFFGEPGNGKSSLALLLASYLKRNICVLSLSSVDNDQELNKYMLSLPSDSILLLEDVDAAFMERKVGDKITGITFSGLLNALDGIGAAEGRILVMTTNHKERLDHALIRTGRVDVQIHVGNATFGQMRLMLKRFFPEATEVHCDRFAMKMPATGIAMSKLQETLIQYNSIEDVLQ